MQLWTGFLLGLAGSVHCAAMCGPLLLAVPAPGGTGAAVFLRRGVYHAGRIGIYAVLGLLFGLMGESVAVAGFQQWVSILAGAILLAGVLFSSRLGLKTPAIRAVGFIKAGFGRLLQQRTLGSRFLLGALNGLLPCGLTYTACAAAAAAASPLRGAEYMAAFGAGTVPMLLAVAFFGGRVRALIPGFWQRAVPVISVVAGGLLLVRGALPAVHGAGKHARACPLCLPAK